MCTPRLTLLWASPEESRGFASFPPPPLEGVTPTLNPWPGGTQGSAKGIMKKVRKRGAKYNDVFGDGAMVFSLGYCASLTFDGYQVLNLPMNGEGQGGRQKE
eukprot:CAMPEP_0117667500 /NCGR_PEP_ID=MMETSP0804-20121206/11008_1 /TAXON_ID=1074897 /ORGANISM="Tetraselmis astigmatica, Strain CCMP880" /LENGTH=101 /DNA_ID=CAMNT_0005475247 /DNA_START=180 /DNA_END=484 /DNA_ORIENTATION=+